MKIDYQAEILREMRTCRRLKLGPQSLEWICSQLGIERGRGGRYSKTAYRGYELVGRALQALKRKGQVVYVGGKGAGWRLP
jgi:hypothetical protein